MAQVVDAGRTKQWQWLEYNLAIHERQNIMLIYYMANVTELYRDLRLFWLKKVYGDIHIKLGQIYMVEIEEKIIY